MNFIKRIVAGPGRHARDPERPPGGQRRRSPTSAFISPCAPGGACNLPETDHHPARPLLHDGRQPWGERRQPLLGTRPPRLDHRQGLRHLLAARPDRHPLATRREAAPAPPAAAPLHASTARFGRRFVAGADEAGRGCLAGPLVAAAVLFDFERLGRSERRALAGLNDSKQKTRRASARSSTRSCSARRPASRSRSAASAAIDGRGLHVTNLAALADALRAVGPGRTRPASSTASAVPALRLEHTAGRRRRRAQRRDRRRLGDRQGDPRPLHAPGRRRCIPAGTSRATSATRPPSTARRSCGTASRRCTAARSSRSPTHSST